MKVAVFVDYIGAIGGVALTRASTLKVDLIMENIYLLLEGDFHLNAL